MRYFRPSSRDQRMVTFGTTELRQGFRRVRARDGFMERPDVQHVVARCREHGRRVAGVGSSRLSPRDRHVARLLNEGRLATLLVDLLTPAEEAADARSAELRFDIGLLAGRR